MITPCQDERLLLAETLHHIEGTAHFFLHDMLLLTPNEILKKTENRILLSISELFLYDIFLHDMAPDTAISEPLILRNVGRLVLGCIEPDFLQVESFGSDFLHCTH